MANLPQDAIRTAIGAMRDTLAALEDERKALENKAEKLRASIRSLEKQIINDESADGNGIARRPKGQNLQDIRAFLSKNPDRGFTPKEISDRLGIGASSVQAVLSKNGEFVVHEGSWKMRGAE